MSRSIRLILLVLPTFIVVGLGAYFISKNWHEPVTKTSQSQLVIVVSFDQFRGDYLERWQDLFGTDGFRRMKEQGAWYKKAHLPYANSSTGPVHASIGTGLPPSIHGIIENQWYDRAIKKDVIAARGSRTYDRVPEMPENQRTRENSQSPLSPERLLVPGIGDRLLEQRGANARVFSFSLKDRAAVFMGGQKPTACYCFDTIAGEFHTSSYYSESAPEWVRAFNQSAIADRWFGKEWNRLGDQLTYDKNAGPDDVEAEKEGVNGQGRTFPHPMSRNQEHPGKVYYDALERSPFGNELLWEFAKSAILAEGLGSSGKTDLLFLGFSSNDIIGHDWGPDSHEVLDVTLRSDQIIAAMMRFLDEQVGPGKYTLLVTADHGICPLPELVAAEQPDAGRFDPSHEYIALNEVIDQAFGAGGTKPAQWVEKIRFPEIFLNRKTIEESGKPWEAVERFATQWLENRQHSDAAFSRTRILGNEEDPPEMLKKVRLSFHTERSGDIVIIPKKYCLPTGALQKGTNHGSPHDYDTHVPLLFYGAGIPCAKPNEDRVSSLLLGETLCEVLGLPKPGK